MGTVSALGQGIVTATPKYYRKGRISLAGDAGAMVAPYTTSGVFKGMKNAVELVTAIANADSMESALDKWQLEQQRSAAGLEKLSRVMEAKLIKRVPNFSSMSLAELTEWWSPIQLTLEEVMG